ncbi:MAG: DNA replication/repair protein RecF [Acidimicrobiales bacterium]
MHVAELWLTDVRSYESAHAEFGPGLTVIRGANGIGKTNLIESLAYLGTQRSFRGMPPDTMVRQGQESAVIRGRVQHDQRTLLVDCEISTRGRSRAQINGQKVTRGRDLLEVLRTTVFAPDDLAIIKAGPAFRRRFLDDVMVARRPKLDALRSEVEKILRQRNALLKQARGRLSDDVEMTLAVWNDKLAASGEELARERRSLLDAITPQVQMLYTEVSDSEQTVDVRYRSTWEQGELAAALDAAREDELRRGVTLVGPHRDDLEVRLNDLPGRTHASQGEQRSLALALKLGGHLAVSESIGQAPVLLLDDVFSELDHARADALVHALPPGQVVLTTAGDVPASVDVEQTLEATTTGLHRADG